MINQIVKLIQAWINGDEAEFEFHLSWIDIGALVIIAGLIIWIIWK